MFRQLAAVYPGGAPALIQLHPSELTTLLELAWDLRANNIAQVLGHPALRSSVDGLVRSWLGAGAANVGWQHLIYAYMIENTRIYEIFRRVLHEFLHGEKLGSPTAASQIWLRNT